MVALYLKGASALIRKRLLAILLLICLCANLFACGVQPDAPTEPSAPTGATGSTDPTDPAPNLWSDYRTAKRNLELLTDYTLHFNYQLTYRVEDNVYLESSVGDVAYSCHGANETIFVKEDLCLGSYETQYYRSFQNGTGYCRVENCNFSSAMSKEKFMAQVVPGVLLNELHYDNILLEFTESSTHYTFTDALQLESWVNNGASVDLTKAHGTADLSHDNQLLSSTYHAEYLFGGIPYTLDVSVTIDRETAPDFSMQPVYGDECAQLNDLKLPKYLIQAVAAIFDAEAISAAYTETMYSEVFALIRTQSGECDLYGTGSNLNASVSSSVSVTDYTGTAVSNTQTVTFANGIYSYCTNGGEPVTVDDVTPEEMRIYCEDTILAALFSLSSIASGEVTYLDDYIYIDLRGNEKYANDICAGIYSILSLNLDTYAASYETAVAGGYLALNRYTMLPTAAGMELERIHHIDNVPFRLTYQLDQSLQLTKETPSVSDPDGSQGETQPTEPVNPLFYEVTGPKGQKLWLFGTIHVGDERTGFLPEQIRTAFENADALAVEFDSFAFSEALLSDITLQQAFSDAYYYNDHTVVFDHLNKENGKKLEILMKTCGLYNINAPYTKTAVWCSRIENFYLTQGSALSADNGMDTRILQWAKEQNKPIYEVESGISQLQMFTGFSDALQEKQLEELFVLGMNGFCADAQTLYELWCAGDEEALNAYFVTDTDSMTEEELTLWKEYKKAMYTNRNKAMAKTAKGYLESGETVFLAVGLAHLLGDGGIIERLQDAGYTVELVEFQ